MTWTYKMLAMSYLLITLQAFEQRDPPQICDMSYLEENFVNKGRSLSDSMISEIRKKCQNHFPYCRSSAYPFLAYGKPKPDHLKVGINGRDSQDRRCWGYYLKVKNQNDEIILSKYYKHGEDHHYGYSQYFLNFTESYLHDTFKCIMVELPSGFQKSNTYRLPENKCQKIVSYHLTLYYTDLFTIRICSKHYKHSNIIQVAKSFCDTYNNASMEFIQDSLGKEIKLTEKRCLFRFRDEGIETPTQKSRMSKDRIAVITVGSILVVLVVGFIIHLIKTSETLATLKTKFRERSKKKDQMLNKPIVV